MVPYVTTTFALLSEFLHASLNPAEEASPVSEYMRNSLLRNNIIRQNKLLLQTFIEKHAKVQCCMLYQQNMRIMFAD